MVSAKQGFLLAHCAVHLGNTTQTLTNSNRTLNSLFLQQLENSLNEFGEKWVLNPGDGAFYGPKASHVTHLAAARRLTAIRRRSSSAGLLCRSTLRSRTPSAATTSAPPSSWTSSSPSALTSPSSGLPPLNPNAQRVVESLEMITSFRPPQPRR